MRLVAIAKDRSGVEEFTHRFWQPPAEIYFDTAVAGHPFFAATNGQEQGIASALVSYLFGGQVEKNWKNAEDFPSDHFKGTGRVGCGVLGSVIVVSPTGEVLYYHKEKVIGDQPDPKKLKAAIEQLGTTGVAACECDREE